MQKVSSDKGKAYATVPVAVGLTERMQRLIWEASATHLPPRDIERIYSAIVREALARYADQEIA